MDPFVSVSSARAFLRSLGAQEARILRCCFKLAMLAADAEKIDAIRQARGNARRKVRKRVMRAADAQPSVLERWSGLQARALRSQKDTNTVRRLRLAPEADDAVHSAGVLADEVADADAVELLPANQRRLVRCLPEDVRELVSVLLLLQQQLIYLRSPPAADPTHVAIALGTTGTWDEAKKSWDGLFRKPYWDAAHLAALLVTNVWRRRRGQPLQPPHFLAAAIAVRLEHPYVLETARPTSVATGAADDVDHLVKSAAANARRATALTSALARWKKAVHLLPPSEPTFVSRRGALLRGHGLLWLPTGAPRPSR
jgi:hypothetical protein